MVSRSTNPRDKTKLTSLKMRFTLTETPKKGPLSIFSTDSYRVVIIYIFRNHSIGRIVRAGVVRSIPTPREREGFPQERNTRAKYGTFLLLLVAARGMQPSCCQGNGIYLLLAAREIPSRGSLESGIAKRRMKPFLLLLVAATRSIKKVPNSARSYRSRANLPPSLSLSGGWNLFVAGSKAHLGARFRPALETLHLEDDRKRVKHHQPSKWVTFSFARP